MYYERENKKAQQGVEEGESEQNETGRRSNKRRRMGENWITRVQDRGGSNKEKEKAQPYKGTSGNTNGVVLIEEWLTKTRMNELDFFLLLLLIKMKSLFIIIMF